MWKENFENLVPGIFGELMDLPLAEYQDVSKELPRSYNRIPDFLKKGTLTDGTEFILHVEFQAEARKDMVLRMLEYFSIITRKFQKPVLQFVIFMGENNDSMSKKLSDIIPTTPLNYKFQLISINSYPHLRFLNSPFPEALILSILADPGTETPASILNRTISKLKNVVKESDKLQKYYYQLEVLSNMRNLRIEKEKQKEAMPVLFNVRELGSYQYGESEKKKAVIVRMLHEGILSFEKIAWYTGATVFEVETLHSELYK